MTCNAHSIEVDRYNIDDIDIVRTFHSISRSRPIVSSSNDTDPDGKTKIITKIGIKLPHRRIVDNLQVKVDDGAEANLLPLHSFRSVFPHTLDEDSYPLDGFFKDSRTRLECYNDGKLVNHGSITLKLKHYSNDSFQDHQFFIVETPACREIIIGHLVSVRLGLIKVMCKNIGKPITAKEAKPNILSQIVDIDGRVPRRQPRSRSEHNSSSGRWKGCKFDSFQDPHSQPLHWYGQRGCKMSSFQDPISRPLCTYNEESLVISDHKPPEQTQLREQLTEAPQEDLTTEFETPFKTLHINRIWVSGEKYIEESHFKTLTDGTRGSREHQRQKLTPFKTMGKSGIKVSRNLTPFKTPDIKHRTGRVHFKTFDDWVKARKTKSDTVLKDVSSFISEKMEEDWQGSYPSCRQPNSWWTKRNGDQTSRSSPINKGEISMGDYHSRRESTMEHREKSTMGAKQSVPWATEATDGKQWPERERFEAKLLQQTPIQQTFHHKSGQKAQKWQKWLISRPSAETEEESDHQGH